MLKLPTVTFIVTSYNYEKYILKTLESIKNQTYKYFEIIVVDDCSSDNSVNLIEKFIDNNQDLKITLIKQESNMGQLASMIRGLKEAHGTFVTFVDSDDVLLQEFAQTHISVHLETSVAFTSCQIAEIGDNDEIHTMNSIYSPHCETLDALIAHDKPNYKILKNKPFGGWYWSPTSSAMFRKASLAIITDYKNTDKWKICPDKFLFNFANLIGGSAIIYSPLTGYRRHSNNAGNCTLVTGNKKFHSDYITKINIENNVKIRPETIKFLWHVKEKLGKRNILKLILSVIFP